MIDELEEEQTLNYNFKLDNFEGPLDLLLEIISTNKMDINDIKLADLTEQYLDYVRSMDQFDMENASEFIEMAAKLIEIKSRELLPPDSEEIEELDNEEVDILQRLKEKKMFKDASDKLAESEDLNKLYRLPDKMANNVKIILKDMVLDQMLDAFVKMMAQAPKKATVIEAKEISKDRFTVAEKIMSIKDIVHNKKMVKFTQLFEEDFTKSELINTFLALLELLKRQIIKAQQCDTFGEIDIISNEENENKEIELDGQLEGNY